jgi:hypothetical protein
VGRDAQNSLLPPKNDPAMMSVASKARNPALDSKCECHCALGEVELHFIIDLGGGGWFLT